MRYIYLLGLLLSLSVCWAQDSKLIKGLYPMETGEGDTIKVAYYIDKYLAPQIPKDKLNFMFWCAEFYGKHSCKNQASFRPYKKSLLTINRTEGASGYTVLFTFLAKNEYGGEGEIIESITFDKDFKHLDDIAVQK